MPVSLWIIFGVALIFLGSLVVNYFISSKVDSLLDENIAQVEEDQRPADLTIVILSDSSCADCVTMQPILQAMREEQVNIVSEKTVDWQSEEGKELVSRLAIKKVPTVVVSGEIEKNAVLKDLFPRIGKIEGDTFVLEEVGGPYVETDTGQVRGRVKLTMLVDPTCENCYDVTINQSILSRNFGFTSSDDAVVDISTDEGKDLIQKYNITLVPTIVLSGDMDIYSFLKQVWEKVGTIEDDGAYVMREQVKTMGVYKDLALNKIIEPVKQLNISGSEFSFNPASIPLEKGEKVELVFTNSGSVPHDFVIDELGIRTQVLSPGEIEIVSINTDKAGTFSYYCSVEGHREAGMEGKIIIQ